MFLDDAGGNSEVPAPCLGFLCALGVVLGQELPLLSAEGWGTYLFPQVGLLWVYAKFSRREMGICTVLELVHTIWPCRRMPLSSRKYKLLKTNNYSDNCYVRCVPSGIRLEVGWRDNVGLKQPETCCLEF